VSLTLQNVAKRVAGETHIHPSSLTLERGVFNTLLGTTLSGKTTLMRLMAGLEAPSSGSIVFDGKDVTGVPVRKRNVSMVYQQFINYPSMSVRENIASPLKLAGIARQEINDRVSRMARLLKIDAMLDRAPSELSGGQQQRCAMARALVKDSDLILMDEPLANLDFKLREELRDELPKLFADRNCVVVYATTEPSEALLLGGNTVALHEGGVVAYGSATGIYRDPESLLAARVFSEPPLNVADVTKRGDAFYLQGNISWPVGDYASLRDGEYRLGIRAHRVSAKPVEGAVAIPARVQVAELSGSDTMLHVQALGHDWVSLSRGVHTRHPGEETTLYAHQDAAFFFDGQGQRVEV